MFMEDNISNTLLSATIWYIESGTLINTGF